MQDYKTILHSISLIQNSNGLAYFVGGAVRDFFLDILDNNFDIVNIESIKLSDFVLYLVNNNKDIDIATSIYPDKIYEIFTNNGFFVKTTLVTNIAVKNKTKLEITTLRKDVNPDGRWTQTEFAKTIQEDSSRRDFTVNAIYIEPIIDTNSVVIHDFYNGIDDLKNKHIRFINNPYQRIREDYLRMLRFFRFSCRFSQSFDKDAVNACQDIYQEYINARNKNEKGVVLLAKERIKDEIIKILSDKNYKMFLKILITPQFATAFCQRDTKDIIKSVNLLFISDFIINYNRNVSIFYENLCNYK